MMPGKSARAQLLFQRVDAEAQIQVEHVGPVFDQQVSGRHRRPAARTPADGASTRRHVAVSRRGCSRARKRTESPGLKLAHLPQLGVHDGRGTDEAAEAGSVRPENHRHVAGEIHRADGVGVVVNVRRMQPRLAAILARPLRLGTDQPNPGAVGIVVHLPGRGEEHLDIVGREEIRRAVRPVEDADVPLVGEYCGRTSFGRCTAALPVAGRLTAPCPSDVQHVARRAAPAPHARRIRRE